MKKIISLLIVFSFLNASQAGAGGFSQLIGEVFGFCFFCPTYVWTHPPFCSQPASKPVSVAGFLSRIYSTEKRRLDSDEIEGIKNWLKSGADVEERDPNWNVTPIMLAFQAADLPCIKILKENGANIWATNGKFRPFNYIRSIDDALAISKTVKSIALLVSFVAHRELRRTSPPERLVVQTLIQDGADPTERDTDGKTAYEVAERIYDEPLMRLLASAQAKMKN